MLGGAGDIYSRPLRCVRIEDVMVIREGGAEIITKAPKELVVL